MMNKTLSRPGLDIRRMVRIVWIFGILGFTGSVLSCAAIAHQLGEGAQGMGDTNWAKALTQSSNAIEKAAEDITPDQEYYIGRTVGATLLSNYSIYAENPDLTYYLNEITAAIVINSPQPDIFNGYHTVILDSDEINAFATSGGHIFITRGLLDCASSEDTLAAVIAHEVAHIQLRHSIKAIKSSRITNAFVATGSSVASLALSDLVDIFDEAVGEIVTTLNNGYSQDQEFEADDLALYLLVSAGYDPSSLVTMLQSLQKNQPGHSGGFYTTHPTPENRIAKVEKPLRQYKVRDTRSYRESRFVALR
jgi:predicted Zn-dependent protease